MPRFGCWLLLLTLSVLRLPELVGGGVCLSSEEPRSAPTFGIYPGNTGQEGQDARGLLRTGRASVASSASTCLKSETPSVERACAGSWAGTGWSSSRTGGRGGPEHHPEAEARKET